MMAGQVGDPPGKHSAPYDADRPPPVPGRARGPFPWQTPRVTAATPDPTRLEPAGVGTLVEIVFRIARRHWGLLLGLSAIFGLPAALVSAASALPLADAFARHLPAAPVAPEDLALSPGAAEAIGGGIVIALAGSLLSGVLATVAGIAFMRVGDRDYRGLPAGLADAARHAIARAPAAIGLSLLILVATLAIVLTGAGLAIALVSAFAREQVTAGGPGVFLALAAIVATVGATIVLQVRTAVGAALVAVAGEGAVPALRRSVRLTAGNGLRVIAVLLLTGLLAALAATIAGEILAILVVDLLLAPAGAELVGELIVSATVSIVVAPIAPLALVALVYDLRVRNEGLRLATGPGGPDARD